MALTLRRYLVCQSWLDPGRRKQTLWDNTWWHWVEPLACLLDDVLGRGEWSRELVRMEMMMVDFSHTSLSVSFLSHHIQWHFPFDFSAKSYYLVIVFACAGMHESLVQMCVHGHICYNGCMLETHVCMFTHSKRGRCFAMNVWAAEDRHGAICHCSSHHGITQHDVTVHSAAQQVALGF